MGYETLKSGCDLIELLKIVVVLLKKLVTSMPYLSSTLYSRL